MPAGMLLATPTAALSYGCCAGVLQREDPWTVRILPRVQLGAPHSPAYGLSPNDPSAVIVHHALASWRIQKRCGGGRGLLGRTQCALKPWRKRLWKRSYWKGAAAKDRLRKRAAVEGSSHQVAATAPPLLYSWRLPAGAGGSGSGGHQRTRARSSHAVGSGRARRPSEQGMRASWLRPAQQ